MQEASRATPGMDRASTGLVLVGEWRVAVVDSRDEAVLKMINFTVK